MFISPILKSKFRQLQDTGKAAELFFLSNYKKIQIFENGILQDARTFGDGYNFQIDVEEKSFLAEVKGLKLNHGSVRLTNNEFLKAQKHKDCYALVVVSNLEYVPKLNPIFNPLIYIKFTQKDVIQKQILFYSEFLKW